MKAANRFGWARGRMVAALLGFLVVTTLAACGASAPQTDAPSAPVARLKGRVATDRAASVPAAVQATSSSVTPDMLMDWAETTFADLFPEHQTTQTRPGFVFRYYPKGNSFIAVKADGGVYVLFLNLDSQVKYIAQLVDFTCQVNPSDASCLPTGTSGASYLMVFASNMQASSGGCTRDDPAGCDLFSANFNDGTKAVTEVTRLTTDAAASEMFPSVSPDANWVAYDYALGNTHSVRLINLQTKQDIALLANARFPEWIDATHLLVSNNVTGSKDVMLLELDLSTSTPSVKTSTLLCNRTSCAGTSQTSDAYPFPNGTRIAFQSVKSDQDVAAVSTVNLDGSDFKLITGWDGSGHTIVNGDGSELVCTVAASGVATVYNLTTSARTALNLPKTGTAMAAYDSRYASMASTNWVYAAWLKTSRSLLFSAQGGDASKVYKLSRLMLAEFDANWANPSVFDLSSAIESVAGKTGKDFCTISARAVSSAAAKPPIYGILGAVQGDFSAIKTLGANTAQIPIPASASAFNSMLAAANTAGVQVMLSIDKSQIQTSALKFDLGKLGSLLTPLTDGLANSSVAGVLLAEDLCHVDPSTKAKKWDITSAELSEAIQAVKGIVPGMTVVINFSKSSCLDTYVSGAAAGSKIADVAVLNFFYYKWSTTPDLTPSYNVSALAFKQFAPTAKVIPKIGVMQTVGNEASAFPSTSWIVDRSNEFLSYGSAFDGVLYYDYRQQLPTETKTISDVVGDSAYVSALQTVLGNAKAAYTR